MDLEYLVVFACLTALLALTVSAGWRTPHTSNVGEFLVTVAVAAKHPGSCIRMILYLPESSTIEFKGIRIILHGFKAPRYVSDILSSWGLGYSSGDVIELNFEVKGPKLKGGAYVVQITSTSSVLEIEVLETIFIKG